MKRFWHLCKTTPAPLRLGLFFLSLGIIWLPLAAPLYLIFRADENLTTILTMGLLFLEFLVYLPFWVKQVHGETQPFRRYGLVWQRANGVDLVTGLAYGLGFTWALLIFEDVLGFIEIIPPTTALIRIVIEGALSGLGVALAEELVFRGWVYDELERDYGSKIVLWGSAIAFAILHFLKPLPEMIRTLPVFPGLVLLGLTLVWAKRSRFGRLGKPIGLHGGLVWGYYIFNVGGLIQSKEGVSPWLTGVDGNPLGGLWGILFLAVLAWIMARAAQKSQKPSPLEGS
ncbi:MULTISPECIES: type II CAAX endopeptidase family protein [Cyanophyceae]|uniref:type II CAAX endopeptidase family protein n=1 Tax=Cyanophyceae TaxID=3028117 RepID=UPI00016DCADB|nr:MULTISPECIES: type II CAAX endopeptidase family protein [Cyanophyceae]ACB00261.1 CAAX amino terminal protease family protein [Picosynechococcus sp. PCC 7002]